MESWHVFHIDLHLKFFVFKRLLFELVYLFFYQLHLNFIGRSRAIQGNVFTPFNHWIRCYLLSHISTICFSFSNLTISSPSLILSTTFYIQLYILFLLLLFSLNVICFYFIKKTYFITKVSLFLIKNLILNNN